jgi:hypothetical protein
MFGEGNGEALHKKDPQELQHVATLIKTFKTREWDHPGPQHPSTMKI